MTGPTDRADRLDRLYDLLPAAVRIRDELEGGPLHDLLRVIAEQVAVVEDDLDRLYDDWFVETAADWAVPYLGDLLGYRPVSAAGELATAAPEQVRVLVPRREVAATIRAHRRKGTLALLEELTADVTGWPARAVEFARLLAVSTHPNHPRDRGRVADLHDVAALDLLDGPFDTVARGVDVRRASSARRPGLANLPGVGVFVWRLRPYPVSAAPATCVEEDGPSSFTFSTLGNDTVLFAAPVAEVDETTVADEINLPVPLRRRALAAAPDAYHGPGRSFLIEAGVRSHGRVTRRPVRTEQLVVADLTGWRYRPRRGTVAVDPVLGRIAFPPGQPPTGVWVSYHYGFSADIGGGEYPRRLTRPGPDTFHRAVRKPAPGPARSGGPAGSIEEALRDWDAVRAEQPTAVVEILDSEVYAEQLDITLHRGERLEIRAADRTRPVVFLLDRLRNAPDSLVVRAERPGDAAADGDDTAGSGDGGYGTRGGGAAAPDDAGYGADPPDGSAGPYAEESSAEEPYGDEPPAPRPGGCLRLDGLLIAGRAVHLEGPLQQVEIVDCTLVPGWGLRPDCTPQRPAEPSLEVYLCSAHIRIERSILGSIQVYQDEVTADPVPIDLADSILDATADDREAVGAPNWPLAHAAVSLRRCTVIGEVQTAVVPRAENSIVTGTVRVARRQVGCVRHCYVPPGSRTPRRFHCQPDLAVEAGGADEAARVRPTFTSTRYGRPGYAQLRADCADEIVRGADDESEMGAFHDLYQPQRLANLRARLAEFTPVRTDVAVLLST